MFNPSTRILLAVSGGVDSMVMLHAFHRLGLPFGIAHCNFQLRGAESDADADFVHETADRLSIPVFIERFDTATYAQEKGISTQMAARDLRYDWFAILAEQEGYQAVATAHNLNDSVETALLNFIRGTGLSGMTGISPRRDLWRRPMLFASREEILACAAANQISWREDSSNASDDYGRNMVRHHILPVMTALNPNVLFTAERNLARFQEAKDNLDYLTYQYLGIPQVVIDGSVSSYSIDKQKLTQLPAPRRVLREILKPHGFSEEQARQLAENLDHVGLELRSSKGWQVLCDRAFLIVRNVLSEEHPPSTVYHPPSTIIYEDDLMVRLPDGISLVFMPVASDPPFPNGKNAVVIDRDKLTFPLNVRQWAEGDVFQPFGMQGKQQKLQDFFTNHKLSRIEKEEVWLLVNGDGTIIWVLGMRLDARFAVHATTVNALKVACTH